MATAKGPEHGEVPDSAAQRPSRRTFIGGAARGGIGLSIAPPLTSHLWTAAPSQAATHTSGLASPRRGGRLRVGMPGGGSSETLNPNRQLGEMDTMRTLQLYERLVDIAPDGSLVNKLAADFSADPSATTWKIKLKPGVLFHDGSTLTADDVVYSLRYILDPANKAVGQPAIAFINPHKVRRLDALTVEIALDQPLAILPTMLSDQSLNIFKAGTTSFDRPNGTGPWKFASWTRGERSLFVRFDHYRTHGGPYLDALEILSINDPTTRFNALVAGQIDATPQVTAALAAQIQANAHLRLLNAPSGVYTCQYMQVSVPPFTDKRVRQAFRLLVDRRQMIQTALSGFGTLGNDLACPFDADYARSLPQHQHDPERAKALLKAAGQANLKVDLYTSDVAPAMLDSSTLLAEQAKAAGVTINLKKTPADQYYAGPYLKVPFACTSWGYRALPIQIADALVKTAPYNETTWNDPTFNQLVDAARRTLDAHKRHELWVAAQRILWEHGGYIIWGFLNNLDALSSKVHGLTPSVARPLGRYNFLDVYLA